MPRDGIFTFYLVQALYLTGLTMLNLSITCKVCFHSCFYLIYYCVWQVFESYVLNLNDTGQWVDFHLLDAVRLLDGKGKSWCLTYNWCRGFFHSSNSSYPCVKGFTCYWASSTYLWRITECYFDVYETWHGWSNVACVHRSYTKLSNRMENRFLLTLNNTSTGQ